MADRGIGGNNGDGRDHRLPAAQPDAGDRCVADVTSARSRVGDESLSKLLIPDFVGRERESRLLREAVSSPRALVLIEGEAGIGKSRLLLESLRSLSALRGHMLTAVCPPMREPFTLGPIVEALRQASDQLSGLRLSGLQGVLRPLFPEWSENLPPMPEPAEDATASRHRVFRALMELIESLDLRVLLVEDVHWADEATLEFLLSVASLPKARTSVVVTYRREDVPSGSSVLRLSTLRRPGVTSLRLALDPLDEAETANLVASMLEGRNVSHAFASFLHERTEGVPLAIEESVRLMYDRGDLIRRDGAWVRRHLPDIVVPPTVRDAVQERLERLSDDAQAVLRAAAVVGDPVDDAMLMQVVGFRGTGWRNGVAEAMASGLLQEDARQRKSFRHMLAGRAVYDSVPAAERRMLHKRAGDALETVTPKPLARLARHFRGAGDTAAWCRYGEQAGDLALASGDEATAGVLFYDLIVHADPPARQSAALISKFPFGAFTGRARFEGMAHALRSVLDRRDLTLAQEAVVRLQFGRLLLMMEDFAVGTAELERAVLHLRPNSVEMATAMTLLGWPRGPAPASSHLRWLRRATSAISVLPAADRLRFVVGRVSALLLLGDESGWAEAAEIPDEVQIGGMDRQQVAIGQLNVGESALLWGRYAEARQRLARAFELADRYQLERVRHSVLGGQVRLEWCTGAWDGLAARAGALAGGEDMQPVSQLGPLLVRGLLHSAAGDRERAAADLRRVYDSARQHGALDHLPDASAALARLHLHSEQPDDALRVTADAMETIVGKGIWLWAGELAPARVQALLAAARSEEAVELVGAYGRGLRNRDAPAPKAGLALCRALLAEGRGGPARAAGLFAAAAAAWQALPRPYDALLARERQAACLIEAGKSEAGLSLLSTVVRELDKLGATGDADRADRRLRTHGRPAPRGWRGGQRGYGANLSPRELEVVRLVSRGNTNREIAAALVRSPDTIATQLKSAMRKFGVSSRAALVARVVEAGVIAAGPP